MNESGYYPAGVEYDSKAPWNQTDNPEKEVEVTISITISKTVKVKVKDYEIIDSGKDEDGDYFENIDYSNCDLEGAVREQVVLPQDAWFYMNPKTNKQIKAYTDISNWIVDDIEIIKE